MVGSRALTFLTLFAAVIATAVLTNTPVNRALALGQDEHGGEHESELHEHMENIASNMRKLRRSLREADKNEDSLKLVVELQKDALSAKAMTPPKAAKVPEAERARFVAGFRQQIARLTVAFLNLEIALLDGDNAKAQEIYDHLQQLKKDGHATYAEGDEEDEEHEEHEGHEEE